MQHQWNPDDPGWGETVRRGWGQAWGRSGPLSEWVHSERPRAQGGEAERVRRGTGGAQETGQGRALRVVAQVGGGLPGPVVELPVVVQPGGRSPPPGPQQLLEPLDGHVLQLCRDLHPQNKRSVPDVTE